MWQACLVAKMNVPGVIGASGHLRSNMKAVTGVEPVWTGDYADGLIRL
jgi:hypothetical protein